MKKRLFIIIILLSLGSLSPTLGQSNFSPDAYQQFLAQNQNLTASELMAQHPPKGPYYKNLAAATSPSQFDYLDSIQIKYHLTATELDLLQKNHFVVTERLNFNSFGWALHDIYLKDLPVMVTTDAILNALHISYDKLLMHLECEVLEPNLLRFLEALHAAYPKLIAKYQSIPNLISSLADVDVYVTLAYSLLKEKKLPPQFANQEQINQLWEAIQTEKLAKLPLFSERSREIDFSQFTVRGHYSREFWDGKRMRNLAAYFQSMIWLGQMDFMLTPPPENPWEEPWDRESIRRMNLSAFMLNELIDLAQVRSVLNDNDQIIRFLVGESDNLTPGEFNQLVQQFQIQQAQALLDDSLYDQFQAALLAAENSKQKILSNFMMMDPFSAEPDTLPISFRLMGQRFIIDSYIFYNLVFPNIIYENNKVWRPLPDPLDALFVLGNDNTLPLLKKELEQYKYASQAAALRYLVDSYDEAFWGNSLYNVWLHAIRQLNPTDSNPHWPLFMQTTAWQQQKMNTQLAAWTQLRHDNLLYAKQSYTGATGCSFPHSFIEPYPELYHKIGEFAAKAGTYFNEMSFSGYFMDSVKVYFPRLEKVMLKLEEIARKENAQEPLTSDEIKYLKSMLFTDGMSGEPPFSGWFADLYYDPWDATKEDYVIADVHTQPTTQSGFIIGNVLHVSVGKVNLGVFLAHSPGDNYRPVAFVGPVMSYYEQLTQNFERLTDERWTESVKQNNVPPRPDWVNLYLANHSGGALPPGRELNGTEYTALPAQNPRDVTEFRVAQNYPNPFNPATTITYSVPKTAKVRVRIYNTLGHLISELVNQQQSVGEHQVTWFAGEVASGLYFGRIEVGQQQQVIKMMLLK